MWAVGDDALSPQASALRESLECSICMTLFKDPKQLSCGHTFCGECVAKLMEMSASSSVNSARMGLGGMLFGTVIACPQCRKQTSVPKDGLTVNFIVKEMVAKMETLAVQQELIINCLACAAPVPCSKVFICRSCTTSGNKTKTSDDNNFFLCSFCAITTHKEHEVSRCSEFASREDNAKAVADLMKSSDYSRRYLEQIVQEQVEIDSAMEQTKDFLTREFQRFQTLIDCAQSSKMMPLKSHLAEQVNLGQKLNSQFHDVRTILQANGYVLYPVNRAFKAYLEFSQKSKKAVLDELRRLNKNLEGLFANTVLGDPLKTAGIETSSQEGCPSTSSPATTNVAPTSLASSTPHGNHFMYSATPGTQRNLRRNRRVQRRHGGESAREHKSLETPQ